MDDTHQTSIALRTFLRPIERFNIELTKKINRWFARNSHFLLSFFRYNIIRDYAFGLPSIIASATLFGAKIMLGQIPKILNAFAVKGRSASRTCLKNGILITILPNVYLFLSEYTWYVRWYSTFLLAKKFLRLLHLFLWHMPVVYKTLLFIYVKPFPATLNCFIWKGIWILDFGKFLKVWLSGL